MEPSTLKTQIDEFEDRNLWFQLLLGFFSATEKAEALLSRRAANPLPASDPRAQEAEDLLIDAALGVLSFRRKLQSEFEMAALSTRSTHLAETRIGAEADVDAERPSSGANPNPHLTDLLR